MDRPHQLLKSFRERSGKSPQEIATAAGINFPSYYDLESDDDEIESCISLGTLQMICAELGVRSFDLFATHPLVTSDKIPLKDIVARINGRMRQKHETISDFESRVGFDIKECLEDSSLILNWNIDCLRYVCAELDVDWRLVLP